MSTHEVGWNAVTELDTASRSRPWEGLEGSDRHAACLIAARSGDRAALDVLVAELTPLVWNVARGRGLDQTTAEDVVQTVWLALLRHLDRLAEPRALIRWLIITTRHEVARTWRRRPAQILLFDEIADRPSGDPLPDDEILRAERDRHLWLAFHRLPSRCQELLRMTVLAGRAEYRAVAEALQMPHGSIGPTRGRCLTALRALYEGEAGS
jgi:RNA polymerase sigma factor (sigma-70 family)